MFLASIQHFLLVSQPPNSCRLRVRQIQSGARNDLIASRKEANSCSAMTPHSLAMAELVLKMKPISPDGLQAVSCEARSPVSALHPPALPLSITVQQHLH